jgi:hypothetical protein
MNLADRAWSRWIAVGRLPPRCRDRSKRAKPLLAVAESHSLDERGIHGFPQPIAGAADQQQIQQPTCIVFNPPILGYLVTYEAW